MLVRWEKKNKKKVSINDSITELQKMTLKPPRSPPQTQKFANGIAIFFIFYVLNSVSKVW